MPNKASIFRFADVEVREREFSVIKAGEALPVEPKAFRVLLFLLRNPQKLITKEELLNAVWGDVAVSDNSLTRSIATLRRLLGDETRNPQYIETVATVGYRWVSKVEVSEEASGEAEPSPAPRPPRKGFPQWLIPSAIILVAGIALAVWYGSRPLPPPRVTAYSQITHDGHIGDIAGTDGGRIYFNIDSWGAVAQVGVLGGEIVPVPTGSMHAVAADLSGDGATLLLYTPDPSRLLTVGTLGGSPRLLADWTGHCGVAWSPDAKYLAYPDCDKNLFVVRSDGTDIRKLATVKAGISDIGWSPDGSRIRFTVDDVLWEVSSSGANLHQVLPGWKGPLGQCCGRWTPDGDFYFFLAGGNRIDASRVGGFEQIWALDEHHRVLPRASPDPVQLTSGPLHWGTPIPSRDGKKIFAVGTTPRGELVRFDSQSKTLQPFLGGMSAEFLAYSSDGTQMSYVTYPEGILWRAKADGSERVQLTSPPIRPFVCRWSPDGTRILFVAARSASSYGLYTISTQGGSPRLLLSPDDPLGQGDGTWSPDGHQIVHQTDVQFSLRILDVDSGQESKIPGSDGLYSPRWSPDGLHIAALTVQDTAIRIFDLQTREWSTLVEHKGIWGFPTWSHDNKFLYALNGPGPWSVYRIPLSGGTPVRVVDLTDVSFVGAVGFWFGLDPDDTPLLLRNNGSSDIYALTLEEK